MPLQVASRYEHRIVIKFIHLNCTKYFLATTTKHISKWNTKGNSFICIQLLHALYGHKILRAKRNDRRDKRVPSNTSELCNKHITGRKNERLSIFDDISENIHPKFAH